MNKHYFITIGRQYGSNGRTIGKMLSEKLGIAYYDKELINIASEKSGLGKEFFENADEKSSHSLLGGLLGWRNSMLDEIYGNNYLCNETLFAIQSDVIRDIAGQQSAVFVGRCADYVLKDEANCMNIFIYADMADRIRRVSERHNVPEKESQALIRKTDKQRAAYYDFYTSKKWGEATSYDLCINSSLLGTEGSMNLIRHAVDRRFLQQ